VFVGDMNGATSDVGARVRMQAAHAWPINAGPMNAGPMNAGSMNAGSMNAGVDERGLGMRFGP